jgi:putative protease
MKKKHLLSLKDLCHLDVLEELAEAGASSFKIEGRLKDMAYVKNVTAAYSEALNALCGRYPDRYCRASKGQVELRFRPDVNKSFNRGFTHYFLHGRNADIFSFDTPKALGSPIGECTAVTPHSILVKPTSPLVNGDGLCFFNQNHTLIGFRVNRVEKRTTVYPHIMPKDLMPGMRLYRNFDKQFTDILAGESAERFIPVDITIDYDGQAFILTFDDGTNIHVVRHEYTPELARTHQSENVIRQLSRLGGTIYRARRVEILYQKNYFIPSSLLAEWRRELVEKKETHPQPGTHPPAPPCEGGEYIPAIQDTSPDYECLANRVTTPLPRREGFCPPITGEPSSTCRLRSKNGVQRPLKGGGFLPLMLCRHCLRYALGWCYKRQDKPQAGSPPQLYLRLANGMRFRLSFDCQQCMMLVYEDKPSRQTTIGQTPITTEQK